jgi:hypothetical protein
VGTNVARAIMQPISDLFATTNPQHKLSLLGLRFERPDDNNALNLSHLSDTALARGSASQKSMSSSKAPGQLSPLRHTGPILHALTRPNPHTQHCNLQSR